MLASKTETNIRDMMGEICEALIDKGYNPINQIMGYILSGDPTYITNHRNARKIITRIGQDELLEELVRFYLYEE
ncbi:MAG: IreB family regulatory phosphoprotein [Defluviitaleaceae bacterium]|nr:IreB family regulatory phosphoprotein [Defluviitaleaceae bacterium]